MPAAARRARWSMVILSPRRRGPLRGDGRASQRAACRCTRTVGGRDAEHHRDLGGRAVFEIPQRDTLRLAARKISHGLPEVVVDTERRSGLARGAGAQAGSIAAASSRVRRRRRGGREVDDDAPHPGAGIVVARRPRPSDGTRRRTHPGRAPPPRPCGRTAPTPSPTTRRYSDRKNSSKSGSETTVFVLGHRGRLHACYTPQAPRCVQCRGRNATFLNAGAGATTRSTTRPKSNRARRRGSRMRAHLQREERVVVVDDVVQVPEQSRG